MYLSRHADDTFGGPQIIIGQLQLLIEQLQQQVRLENSRATKLSAEKPCLQHELNAASAALFK